MAAVSRPVPVLPQARARLRLRGEDRLVALVRDGDPSAFEAVYDRYHQRILAFCRHMLSSREDAEDATQHTFIAAYRDLRRTAQRVELRPWLYRIARNRCISMLRARHEEASIDEVGEPAGAEGLADVVQRREDLRELVADVHRLPEHQRAALVLFELGDLSQAQIADVLGRGPEQVKALVHQARTTLMYDRQARELDCGAVREELATARGPARLRRHLRRHLAVCPGCTAYSKGVRRQRAELALVIPAIPTAGLKAASLAGTIGGAGAAGAGTAGGLAASGGVAVKALVAVALGGGAVGATVEVGHHHRHSAPSPRATAAASARATAASPSVAAAQPAALRGSPPGGWAVSRARKIATRYAAPAASGTATSHTRHAQHAGRGHHATHGPPPWARAHGRKPAKAKAPRPARAKWVRAKPNARSWAPHAKRPKAAPHGHVKAPKPIPPGQAKRHR